MAEWWVFEGDDCVHLSCEVNAVKSVMLHLLMAPYEAIFRGKDRACIR